MRIALISILAIVATLGVLTLICRETPEPFGVTYRRMLKRIPVG